MMTTQITPYRSIPAMLQEQAVRFGSRNALSYKKEGRYVQLRYDRFYERVLMAARGLGKLGVQPGEKVAILSENRAGWVIADLGILCSRGVTVPVYATNTADQVEYVLNHAGCRLVFVSNRHQYEKLLRIRQRIPQVETVIAFERFFISTSVRTYFEIRFINSV